MERISVYIISLLAFMIYFDQEAMAQDQSPDTITIPLKIFVGADIVGPGIYFFDKTNFNAEGYVSVDLNSRTGIYLGAGYSDYIYSQYNYEYLSNGLFLKAGVDFNLLKPEKSKGKYWAGIGLRYGLSSFTREIPSLEHDSYWGTTVTTIASSSTIGHYFELAPGFRAEIFKNFSMGWSINLKALLYTGTGKDMRPIYFPGYGKGDESVNFGINYFLSWNIPYKKIKVRIKQEETVEPEDLEEGQETDNIEPPSLFSPAEYP